MSRRAFRFRRKHRSGIHGIGVPCIRTQGCSTQHLSHFCGKGYDNTFSPKSQHTLSDFEENNRSETRRLTDFVSVLGVARTTPEIYCERARYCSLAKIKAALQAFREKCNETRKLVDSVSVLRVARTTPEIYCKQYGIIFPKIDTSRLILKKSIAAKREKRLTLTSVLRAAHTAPEILLR